MHILILTSPTVQLDSIADCFTRFLISSNVVNPSLEIPSAVILSHFHYVMDFVNFVRFAGRHLN